jgi:hypothetical protein
MTANPINENRVRIARQKLREAQAELDAVLADAERPKSETPPKAVKVYKPKTMRRVS